MKPNVLLVVLDSVRAENTSLHGYNRLTTPFLDSFAQSEATYYTQARAPGMKSRPSHTSMFCGLEVGEHNVYDSIRHTMESGHTIWEKLQEDYNYRTGVFSDNVNLVGDTVLRDGFDHVERGGGTPVRHGSDLSDYLIGRDGFESTGLSRITDYAEWSLAQDHPISTLFNGAAAKLSNHSSIPELHRSLERSSKRYTESFLSWSNEVDGPWAACINLMDAHNDYRPNPEFDQWGGRSLQKFQAELNPHPWKVHGGETALADWMKLEPLYDGAIRQVDAAVQRIVASLKERGEFDETLLIVCADHGEGFGEESRVQPGMRTIGHVAGLHEVLLHVPLIVSLPGQTAPDTVDDLATLRKFHDVVLNVVNGNRSASFVPTDRAVVASGSNIDDKLENTNRAAKFVDNTDPYRGVVHAVFEDEGDILRKHMTWREHAATIEIKKEGGHARIVEEPDTRILVEEAFEPLTDAGVRQDRSGRDDVDEGTKRRLADLGYV